jgi:hypothetical protein
MHHSAANEPPYQSNPISQLSQLTIQIQSTALDLSNYECFIGSENIGFIMEGTEQMMFALQNVLGGPNPEGKLGERETRHEFRNKLAVIKGFGDLIKMDLPQNHAAFLPLQRLSERCTRFSAVLDGFAATGLVQTYRMAG